jgi:hypothetical protein
MNRQPAADFLKLAPASLGVRTNSNLVDGTSSSSNRATSAVPPTGSSTFARAVLKKTGKILPLLVILTGVLGLPAHAASQYIFATFKGDSAALEKLWIYTSTNGLNFTQFTDTGGYAGPTGVLRDPSIMKHTDGKYYIAHTVQSWITSSTNFAIASSPDLVHWTNVTTVNAGVSGTYFTWAPEWFVDDDGTVNIIVSLGPQGSSFRPYIFTAQNSDLTSWSGPVDMGIGVNHIDTFVVKAGDTYHVFAKNETTKYIEHATSSSLTNGWTWMGTGNWAGWGSGIEGPALVQMDNGQWRIYVDAYSTGGGIKTATSADLNSSWSGLNSCLTGVKHGTVIKETAVSPLINVSASGSNLTLSWPLPSLGFTLGWSTNLVPSAWTAVSPAPQMVGSQWQATVSVSESARYYRLQK